MTEHQPASTGAPSNVVKLPDATRIAMARRVERRISAEMSATNVVKNAPAPISEHDDYCRGLAHRLRVTRIALGLTQAKAASDAYCTLQTWVKYETTGRMRGSRVLRRFGRRYDISLDWLVAGDPGNLSTRSIGNVTILPAKGSYIRQAERTYEAMGIEATPPRATVESVVEDCLRERGLITGSTGQLSPTKMFSETGRNERLRSDRRDVWRRARAETDYWEAMQQLCIAMLVAQREGIPAALSCPKVQMEDYNAAYREYQTALLAQMLTPAPDVASVNWKRRRAFGRRASWHAEQFGQIQGAIIADEAFLKSHPTRHRTNRSRRN
jgi:transcriptional regulator with XRE-family HTH domain